ncbi:MAG TPA: LptA/OstA family protein [Caulobacteraceae bacterium]
MKRRIELGLAASVAGLIVAAAAGAQVDTKSNAPIDITANQAEVINSKCLAIWRGAAEALQGDSRLRADTISVYAAPKGVGADGQPSCGGTQKVVADGHVYYVTPTQNARGDHAVYLANADEIVLTGDVIVVQGKDVARGDKLTIKTKSKQFIMESRAGGTSHIGRVRGVVYPDKQAQPDESPKP